MMTQPAMSLLKSISSIEPFVVIHHEMSLQDIERSIILATLRKHRNNRTRTAKVLGIGIRTLQRRLKQYNAENSANVANG